MTGLHASIRVASGVDRRFDAATPQALGELVDVLAEPESHDASIVHTGRGTATTDGGEQVADHVLHVAVRDGFAYLHYRGPVSGVADIDDAVVSLGSPASPEVLGRDNVVFPASTGLELAHFTEALHEFVRTGELPTCVQWARASEVESGTAEPLSRTVA